MVEIGATATSLKAGERTVARTAAVSTTASTVPGAVATSASAVTPTASAAPVTQADTTTAAAATTEGVTASLSGVAQQLAATPPVDSDRIARIKKAIADGTFPFQPATVADRLLALQLNWNSHDKA